MHLAIVLAVQLTISGSSAAQTTVQVARQATILHCGQLLKRWDLPVEANVSIVVADGRIVTVSDGFVSSATVEGIAYSDDTPLDLRPYFVLPGLIEGHAHVSYFRGGDSRVDTDTKTTFAALRNLQALYRKGFTTVRDMGSESDIFDLRDAIDEGLVDSPRLLAAGLRISATGGPMDPVRARREDYDRFRPESICDGPIDCIRATRFVASRGADHIKIFGSGAGSASPESITRKQFTDDELAAIISTAELLNLSVAAHAHGDEAIRAVSSAGATTIEHGWFMSGSSAEAVRKDGAILVPTISPLIDVVKPIATVEPPSLPEPLRRRANSQTKSDNYLRSAVKAGVTIMFGSDVAGERFQKDMNEPQYMAEWGGMSPRQILESATVIPAGVIGLTDDVGQIGKGFSADIIAVGHDPTERAIDLANVVFVMGKGRTFIDVGSLKAN